MQNVLIRGKLQDFLLCLLSSVACFVPVSPHISIPEKALKDTKASSPGANPSDVAIVILLDFDPGELPSSCQLPVAPTVSTAVVGGRCHH